MAFYITMMCHFVFFFDLICILSIFMSFFGDQSCPFRSFKIFFYLDATSLFYIQGGLNLSSSQPRSQLPDNSTIRDFLKTYADNFMGGY